MCPPCCRACKAAGKNVEGSTARAGAKRSERGKCGNHAPGIPKGAALGAPLVTFSATGKSPGVEGRSALPMGVLGAQPPLGEERGAKSDDLLLEGRSPSSHRWVLGLPAPHKPPGPYARFIKREYPTLASR